MPIVVTDRGVDNRVEIDPVVAASGSGSIMLAGHGGWVRIAPGCSLSQASITLGDGCSLEVGEGCRLAAIEIMAQTQASVAIGAGTNFTWHSRLFLHEPSRIAIGRACLIASETLFTTSDMHSIIDRQSGQRVNQAADIVVGDRVWIAYQAILLKGSLVEEGSIVGLGSVVSGCVAAYSLCAGRPARPVRQNVTWDPALL